VAEPEPPGVLVFVYGTLTDPARVADVLDGTREWSFVADATLRGLHRVDGQYPTLAPGGRVDGRLLQTDAVAALDAYEGVDRGLYLRVPVPFADDGTVDGGTDDESDAVAVYVGDPERLGVDEAVAWPGAGDLGRRVGRYVAANDVAVEPR